MSSMINHPTKIITVPTTSPLYAVEQQLLNHQTKIECWLRKEWLATPPPLYSSVDLRNAGFKLAAIDTNLFSAGFNNLNAEFLPLCIQAAQSTLTNAYPTAEKILLIPESHTRNQYYLESVAVLTSVLTKAGYLVAIGSLLPDLTEPLTLNLPSGAELILNPVQRSGDRIAIANFEPDLVLLNHDMSDGVPALLQNISQPICPPLTMGWSHRLKSTHFQHYQDVCDSLGKLIGLDPWCLSPYFRQCGEVDFMHQKGLDCLEYNADLLLQQIRYKYKEHGITHEPFICIKADAGTYGMGVMMISDPKQLATLNRKQRTHMSTAKGNQPITKVILQEGVYSFETWPSATADQQVAEPVIYMLGQYVVGGFYRVHSGRGINENLNSPGMHFEPLAFATCCNNPCQELPTDHYLNRFYTYSVVARLAALAAAREIAAIQ